MLTMLQPKRKERYDEFDVKKNPLTAILLGVFFLIGFLISRRKGIISTAAYLFSWIASYFVLFAGTCSKCVYYGKSCPIPFEGSCVHYFVEKKKDGFGFIALFWAGVAYMLRGLIPSFHILRNRWIGVGIIYYGIFSAFWFIHSKITGCPNCINVKCPSNPDFKWLRKG